MSWDLSEFEKNRLEKGRKLLQESEEHRGCRDLRLYVESMDLQVKLHRIFLDDSGQQRQGLTEQEKLQGLIVFLHVALRNMAAMFNPWVVTEESSRAVKAVVTKLWESPMPWGGFMANLVSAASNCLRTLQMPTGTLQEVVEGVATIMSRPDLPALSAAAEAHQRNSGFNPVLSAADMRLLMLYSHQEAATVLLQRQPEAPAAQQWLAAGLSANRQLLQLDPNTASFLHCKRGGLLIFSNQRPEAVAALRSALHEGSEHKSLLVEAVTAQQLATILVAGHAGPRWSVEEVKGLLKTSKTGLAKCKWAPPNVFAHYKTLLAETTQDMNAVAARNPGAAMLPAVGGEAFKYSGVPVPRCSGCGQQSSSLKKCSSCGVAAYCSRACQVRHWKEGGHKQECAQLAAEGSSGGAIGIGRS